MQGGRGGVACCRMPRVQTAPAITPGLLKWEESQAPGPTPQPPPPCRPPLLAGFMAVRLGFLISLLATFSLQMAPFRDSLWKLLFRQELQVGGAGRMGVGGRGAASRPGTS